MSRAGRISLPSQIIEQIEAKNANGEYNTKEDSRFDSGQTTTNGRKRKAPKTVSRKDKRKEERLKKKQKQYNNHTRKTIPVSNGKGTSILKPSKKDNDSKDSDEEADKEDEDPLEQLRKIKAAKSAERAKNAKALKASKATKLQEVENIHDPLEQLRKIKAAKLKKIEDDPMEQLRILKEMKNGKRVSTSNDIKIVKESELNDDEISEGEFDVDDLMEEDQDLDLDLDLEDENLAEEEEEEEEDPLEQLRKLKEAKGKSGKSKSNEIRIVKEDDLLDEDDDISDDLGEESDSFETTTTKQPRLQKQKTKNGSSSSSESEGEFEGFSDSDVKKDQVKRKNKKSILKSSLGSKITQPEIVSNLGGDKIDDDLTYYAKQLGLKNGKNSKLIKEDDDDMIGGILDGLDLDFDDPESSDEEKYGDDSLSPGRPNLSSESSLQPPPRPPATALDDDLDYYAKKLGISKRDKLPKSEFDDGLEDLLEGLEFDSGSRDDNNDMNSNVDNGDVSDFDDSDASNATFSSDDNDDFERERENPYLPPSANDGDLDENETITENSGDTQRYIPPALRRRMAMEAASSSSETLAEEATIKRLVKGSLNKLSEANITSIINEINALYMTHPRQILNEVIVSIVLESIIQQGRLLESFVYLHAALVVALYKLQGVEFGAFFIQKLIESFKSHHTNQDSKEASNLISLLSSVFLLHLVSSKLIYDIVRLLISNLNERNADLLLRLVQNSGNQMRSESPSSLKQIIALLNEKYTSLPSSSRNTRVQFLVETISSLKNNKLKILNEANYQQIVRLRKVLSAIGGKSGGNDAIQVSLEDIESIDTRGKWWLVGSAWKGHESETNDQSGLGLVNESAVKDVLDASEPNWMELAKSQRMNTAIRRAIFISIVSATDFMDARTKLDKLALKKAQERDIPKVLVHCTTMETAYNPYYALLANNLCESHSFRKTFQFILWDVVKGLDGQDDRSGGNYNNGDDNDDDDGENEDINFMDLNEVDEETRLKKVLNLGRFFGYLIAENAIPLHSLKTVNFLSSSSNSIIFVEALLVKFLDVVGKKSKKKNASANFGSLNDKNDLDLLFDDKLLVERVVKAKDETTLLRGLQYFLQERVKNSGMVTTKKQEMRVSWGVDAMFDVIDELLKNVDV